MTTFVKPSFYKKNFSKMMSNLTHVYGDIERRVKVITNPKEAATKVIQWLSQQSVSEESKTWLTNLPPEEAEAFSKQLGGFCGHLNFDLLWLIDADLDDDPELKAALTAATIAYTEGYWQAVQVQDDIKMFVVLQEWLNSPKSYAKLNQKLFTALIAKGAVTPPPATLFLATEEERESYIINSLKQALEQDRLGVIATLKELDEESRQAFTSLPEWLGLPPSEAYVRLTQKLYAAMLEARLVAEPPATMFLAPEDERREYIVKAISQAIEKDEEAVLGVLNKIKATEAQDSAATEEVPAEEEIKEALKPKSTTKK